MNKRDQPGYVHPRTGTKIPPEIRAKMGRPPRPLVERYWAKVDKRGPDECWNWLANKNPHGYGQIYPGPERAKRKADTMFAHHVATELAGIDVPEGMVRDHLCKNRGCQNPAHLRIVPRPTNTRENSDSPHAKNFAKTHCTPGNHPLSGDNLLIRYVPDQHAVRRGDPNPRLKPTRMCRACMKRRNFESAARARAKREMK